MKPDSSNRKDLYQVQLVAIPFFQAVVFEKRYHEIVFLRFTYRLVRQLVECFRATRLRLRSGFEGENVKMRQKNT